MNHTGRLLAAAVSLAAVASLAVTACSVARRPPRTGPRSRPPC